MVTLEEQFSDAVNPRHQNFLASLGGFAVIAFCGSFCGPEVFLVGLHGLRKYYLEAPNQEKDHVIIPLLGRFKGEMNSCYHLAPLEARTDSGLEMRKWVGRLVQARESEGRVRGPAFCTPQGTMAKTLDYNRAFVEQLQTVQATQPGVIPGDLEISETFGISQSFRRGAASVAKTQGVPDKIVKLIYMWQTFESARGRRPAMAMEDHYSDIAIMIPETIKFSQAL
jgi:hypothetical protein